MAVRPVPAVLLAAVCLPMALAGPATAQSPSATGTVISRGGKGVTARTSPGGAPAVTVPEGARLRITCQLSGPAASGPGGRSTIWDRVIAGSRRLYMADSRMRTGPPGVLVAKLCGSPALDPAPTPGATSGPCGITSTVTQLPPFPTRRAFIRAAVPGAQQSARQTQVPASVTLAQAILETGSGRVAAGANNYFGIKASAVPGEREGIYGWGANAVGCVLRKTQEVIGGLPVTTIGAFRAYTSLGASIRDHGLRLLENPVYRPAFAYTDDPERFARIIARRYATDPRYATKVISLMRSERLSRYDVAGSPAAGDPATGGASPGPP